MERLLRSIGARVEAKAGALRVEARMVFTSS